MNVPFHYSCLGPPFTVYLTFDLSEHYICLSPTLAAVLVHICIELQYQTFKKSRDLALLLSKLSCYAVTKIQMTR